MVLTPAYGRDYRSGTAALKDFLDGKDFIYHDVTSDYDGKYCSIRDFKAGTSIAIRYQNMRLVISYKIKESDK